MMMYNESSIQDNDIANFFRGDATKRPGDKNHGHETRLVLEESDIKFGNILEFLRAKANDNGQLETARVIDLAIGKLKRQFAKRNIMPIFSSNAGALQITSRLPRETRFTIDAFLNAIERGQTDIDAVLTHRGY